MTSYTKKVQVGGWTKKQYKDIREQLNRFYYAEIREEREDKEEPEQNDSDGDVFA